MTIAIGCDHAGYTLKEKLKQHLSESMPSLLIEDIGTFGLDSVDYPDYAHEVAGLVNDHFCEYGILICGSANGVAIAANKHQKVRAAICWNLDTAKLARQHNDANIICLPARFIDEALAFEMVSAFLHTSFEGGRHAIRVNKISGK